MKLTGEKIKMTKFVGIISAKGGVGKTTTAINLSSALDYFKRDVIVVDADFRNPNIGIHLGASNFDKNIHGALKGKYSIKETVYKHHTGLKIVPGSISYHDTVKLPHENLVDVILDLANTSEVVIIDSTPGLDGPSKEVIKASDYILVITTPDIASVTASLRSINLATELNKKILGVIVNMHTGSKDDMKIKNIETFLGHKVIGIIPQDDSIKQAFHKRMPVVHLMPDSPSSTSFKKLASELIGQKYVENLAKKEQESLFQLILKRLGFGK